MTVNPFRKKSSRKAGQGFETKAIHAGRDHIGNTGAVIPPMYLTATFEYGNLEGFDYTRSGNPNFRNLEKTLLELEHASYATVFNSGISAITAVVSTLNSKSTILAEENLYGCTYRLFDKVFSKFGVTVEYCDLSKPSNYARIEISQPDIVWVESPTNPLMKIIDIEAIAQHCNKAGSDLVVDNTFASAFVQQPLVLGASLSISSTTKYTNGHSDSLGGVVCTNDPSWHEAMIFSQKALGLNPSPFDTWLISRGAKTLGVRMERHANNALAIAKFFENETTAKLIRYPFLKSHPQHNLARRQMKNGSGMISVDLGLSLEETKQFMERLELFVIAESLGGIESLVCHPATMIHAAIPRQQREAIGITDSLFRFSVGIENIDDLIADIQQALPSSCKKIATRRTANWLRGNP